MKILDTSPFVSPAHVVAGDTLRVTWRDSDGQVVMMETIIEKAQTLDTAVLVEYTPEEAGALGFKSALGTFAGESES